MKYYLIDGVKYALEVLPEGFERAIEITEAEYNAVPVVPQPTNEELLEMIRQERNRRLLLCDWTQLHDAPLTNAQQTAWQEYRQALRDLPETYANNPQNVIFPTEP